MSTDQKVEIRLAIKNHRSSLLILNHNRKSANFPKEKLIYGKEHYIVVKENKDWISIFWWEK